MTGGGGDGKEVAGITAGAGGGGASATGETGGETASASSGVDADGKPEVGDGVQQAAAADALVAPFPADLPPYPSTFRTLDVQREVELVREARKRIRLGAEAYAPEPALVPTAASASASASSAAAAAAAAAAVGGRPSVGMGGGTAVKEVLANEREDKRKGIGKPSVCLFTLHDTGDRYERPQLTCPAWCPGVLQS